MKKLILAFVLLTICFAPAVFAQVGAANIESSELYYVNVTIEKIYAYRLGYIVSYRTSGFMTHLAYIPNTWFAGLDSKAEIVHLNPGREWPSMTVYYLRGEFHHVRLRLRERSHNTWGLVRPGVNMDEYFLGVEDLRLNF